MIGLEIRMSKPFNSGYSFGGINCEKFVKKIERKWVFIFDA
jgi:hypothetical protein